MRLTRKQIRKNANYIDSIAKSIAEVLVAERANRQPDLAATGLDDLLKRITLIRNVIGNLQRYTMKEK
jgi:hypothetical protein